MITLEKLPDLQLLFGFYKIIKLADYITLRINRVSDVLQNVVLRLFFQLNRATLSTLAKPVLISCSMVLRLLDNKALKQSIGFCLSKKHAEFMARVFNKAGIPSEFLVAESESAVRDSVKQRLVTKEITFVFVVDIYNEGIDIPDRICIKYL
ncbi:MAG: hypothetical protein APF81_20730 [Desulfosporosinus sp. BRH_c37]|nr:MAG: hypothetical protein APF81_20730 [Desulfosporosinus sp. BRH_c37]